VLGIELDAPGGLSRAFRVVLDTPAVRVPTECGVTLTYFEGGAALAEYLERVVRLGPTLDKVFAHPLYRSFVAAAPGVKELMVIGKVRDELLLQKVGSRPRWDVVVVDAGASGHALEYLRMPAAARDTFRSGRVHREARRVHALLADAVRTAVHVVTTAEQMPLAEALESIRRLREELRLPVGRAIVNRCFDPPPVGFDAALARLERLPVECTARGVRDSLVAVARRRLAHVRLQERVIDELRQATGAEPLALPRLVHERLGVGELTELAAFFDAELS
jgi:anion-transporting  ArsA/GET3 family ATPase